MTEKWGRILTAVFEHTEFFKQTQPEMYQSVKEVIKKGAFIFGAALTTGIYFELRGSRIEDRVTAVCATQVSLITHIYAITG